MVLGIEPKLAVYKVGSITVVLLLCPKSIYVLKILEAGVPQWYSETAPGGSQGTMHC